MANILAEIIASKEEEWRRLLPYADELRRQALERNDFRPFRQGLYQPGQMTLIAEVKKASPSAGLLVENFDHIAIAREYERAGAHALSVLTDVKYFQGHLTFLRDIRDQVDLPLLRKDFIIHELQIYESIIAGADAVLLIAAALPGYELEGLFDLANSLQLDVLVEVHNLEEMDRALELGADMIGINNRDLHTFEVDLSVSEVLVEEIPSECLAVSESGIKTAEDVAFLLAQGVNTILVGETLMRAPVIKDKIQELLGTC